MSFDIKHPICGNTYDCKYVEMSVGSRFGDTSQVYHVSISALMQLQFISHVHFDEEQQ